MPHSAIFCENISKQYRLGETLKGYDTFRDRFDTWMKKCFSREPFRDSVEQRMIWALRDISFSVNPGEVVGIIGRNGAGKTTLLKILSRITEPTSGRAVIRGKVASILEVGTGFHPELTGRENIFLNGALLGMSRAEIKKRFDEIVEFAEIPKFIDTPVKRYSSGMYVRLAFSVAAHLNAEILLIDEVLAVGDINFQNRCTNRMTRITRSGRTIFLVSHNLRIVEKIADRCIYLKDGSIRAQGGVLETLRAYQKEALGAVEETLPYQFDPGAIRDPRVEVLDMRFHDCDGNNTSSVASGEELFLSFTLSPDETFVGPVIHVFFCRDNQIVSGNNSDHAIGKITLEKNKPVRFSIRYPRLNLTPGKYGVVLFVLPYYQADFKKSLSVYSIRGLTVEGSLRLGGGFTALEQVWRRDGQKPGEDVSEPECSVKTPTAVSSPLETGVAVEELDRVFGFREKMDLCDSSRNKPLLTWKMEEDDAPILRYLYRNFKPRRHLEFGTWLGGGTLICLEECEATVWTLNLPFGEREGDGKDKSVYHSFGNMDVRKWLKKIGFQNPGSTGPLPTDSLGFIGSRYLEQDLGHRVCQVYCDSRHWDISSYPADFFDSVLVDGAHRKDVVIQDTRKAISVLRPGGMILWHDYCPPIVNEYPNGREVQAAVEEMKEWLERELEMFFWIRPSWILFGLKKD